jgi:hypothetical protein
MEPLQTGFDHLLAFCHCLAHLNEIVLGITQVAANLTPVVLWLRQKCGPFASPLLIARPDVGDSDIQEAGGLVRVPRRMKRHLGFIVRRATSDVENQPAIRGCMKSLLELGCIDELFRPGKPFQKPIRDIFVQMGLRLQSKWLKKPMETQQ